MCFFYVFNWRGGNAPGSLGSLTVRTRHCYYYYILYTEHSTLFKETTSLAQLEALKPAAWALLRLGASSTAEPRGEWFLGWAAHFIDRPERYERLWISDRTNCSPICKALLVRLLLYCCQPMRGTSCTVVDWDRNKTSDIE